MMKLSISNIAWDAQSDDEMYEKMKIYGFSGLEIAPTRIFPQQPYERLEEAKKWSANLKKLHGLCIPSMQSIWYGRQEKLFGTKEERDFLLRYTKKAIDFAEAVGCKNLVFGCPKNRSLLEGTTPQSAVSFFRELGDYAAAHKTVIGMEANPPVYQTNYINDTKSALDLVDEVSSEGFRLNLDVGTMICNEEAVSVLEGRIAWINHVHISEPGLAPIQKRTLHQKLLELLKREAYHGFVSIEMGNPKERSAVEDSMRYLSEIVGKEDIL